VLHICAKLLEVELLKIHKLLSTRWVASGFPSVTGVWQNYEVLIRHFEEAKNDNTTDKKKNVCTKAYKEKLLQRN
jgi:hypothetical protein